MKMNLNKILLVIALVVITLLGLKNCSLSKENSNLNGSISLTGQKFDSLRNALGQKIIRQTAILTGNTEQINELTDSIFKLKKKNNGRAISFVRAIGGVRARSIDVPIVEQPNLMPAIPEDANCDEVIAIMEKHTVPVGSLGRIDNDSLKISMTINKESITINKLEVPDTVNFRFVEHRKFLKKRTIEVQYFHTNPLFKTDQINSVFYTPKKKGFWKAAIPVAVGVAAGVLIAK